MSAVVLDLFAIVNLGFLSVDIWIAHSVNAFARWQEWIPFAFSLAAPPLLAATLRRRAGADRIAVAVGTVSILVGLAGVFFHLESQFFGRYTIKSLVYTAPFAAPLAYTGLGFLIVMNRLLPSNGDEWRRWVLFFAAGGFIGNFALSLCDHAQNGFFHWSEWIPVVASAFAAAFLGVTIAADRLAPKFRRACWAMLALQVAVGLAGFGLHLYGNWRNPMTEWWPKLVYGAPIFAPLLFPNLALLAGIGLWGRSPGRASNVSR